VRSIANYEHHFHVIVSSLFEFHYYNMMGMSKSLDELLGLLKTAEEDMNKGSGKED
jgi:hypothetical protein